MKQIRDTFYGLFHNKVDALGLAVFRMLFSVMLFLEAIHLWEFRHVVYDRIPFQVIAEMKYELFFAFWILTLILLFIGLFTRIATILSYVFSVLIFSSTSAFEYHVFYTYVGVSFVMMFMPVSRVFSVDSVIRTAKYSGLGSSYKPDNKVLAINYYVPVFVGIGLVYFDSVFLKLGSNMWLNGLGVWLPSSVPLAVWNDMSWILNNKVAIIALGYFVLVFETVFIFVMWFRRLWLPIVISGISFHIGIFLVYPIPLFAFTYIVLYLLLVPPHYWAKAGKLFNRRPPVYNFYYDAECPICAKTVAVVRQIDVLHRVDCLPVQVFASKQSAFKGIDEQTLLVDIHGVSAKQKVYRGYYAYIALFKSMVFFYPLAIIMSLPGVSSVGKKVYRKIAGDRDNLRCTLENCNLPPLIKPIDENESILVKGWSQANLTRSFWKYALVFLTTVQLLLIAISYTDSVMVGKLSRPFVELFSKFLGLGRHDVFLDKHFHKYNHSFRIDYVDANGNQMPIPLYDHKGMVSSYNSGIIWRNVTFNVVTPTLKPDVLTDGFTPYLNHYLRERRLDESSAEFRLYIREIETTDHWQHDFLRRQMAKPWKAAGTCKVSAGQYEFNWTPEMLAVFASE